MDGQSSLSESQREVAVAWFEWGMADQAVAFPCLLMCGGQPLGREVQRVAATDLTDIEVACPAGIRVCAWPTPLTGYSRKLLSGPTSPGPFPVELRRGGGHRRLDITPRWLDAAPPPRHLTSQHELVTSLVPLQVYG